MSFILFIVLTLLHQANALKEWEKNEFPNPARDVSSCGRRGVASWICDPDGILSFEQANKLEEMLTSVSKNTVSGCSNDDRPGYQIGIALMRQMYVVPGETGERAIEKFAKHLHDSWGVGHECGDGAVFVLSAVDRLLYISTGSAAKSVLTNEQIGLIIGEIKWNLRHQRYDDAVEQAVKRMGEVFAGKRMTPPGLDYGFIMFCLFILGFFIVGVSYAFNQHDKYLDCETKLSTIEKERNAATTKKFYEASSCPICLEAFGPEIKHRILVCGHKYCEPCLCKWLESNSTCPICRQPTNRSQEKGQSPSTTFDYMPELTFRLLSLRHQYPRYVTQEMISRWSSGSYRGSFRADPLFTMMSPTRSGIGSGRGFGGGSSSGGGGRGGSW